MSRVVRKLTPEEQARWDAVCAKSDIVEENRKGFLSDNIYHTILENVPKYKYDEVDNALNKMFEEMNKIKKENKELKEENKKLLSYDKNQTHEITKLKSKIKEITQIYKQNKQQDNTINFGKQIIQDNKPKDKPKNKQFKNGCYVRNRYTREIYKLMSDTKTQFRVIKLRCTSWNNKIVDNKINIAPEAGKDKIKWINNKNITKKRLEDEYYIISDKKNIIFEKPEYKMDL